MPPELLACIPQLHFLKSRIFGLKIDGIQLHSETSSSVIEPLWMGSQKLSIAGHGHVVHTGSNDIERMPFEM